MNLTVTFIASLTGHQGDLSPADHDPLVTETPPQTVRMTVCQLLVNNIFSTKEFCFSSLLRFHAIAINVSVPNF